MSASEDILVFKTIFQDNFHFILGSNSIFIFSPRNYKQPFLDENYQVAELWNYLQISHHFQNDQDLGSREVQYN